MQTKPTSCRVTNWDVVHSSYTIKITDEIISWYTQYCTTVITVRFSLTTRWLLCTLSWSPATTLHMQGPRSKEAHVIFVLFRLNTSVYTCFASFFSPISLCSSSSSRHLLIPWNTVEHQGSKLHNYPLYAWFSPFLTSNNFSSPCFSVNSSLNWLQTIDVYKLTINYAAKPLYNSYCWCSSQCGCTWTDEKQWLQYNIIAVGVTKWCN